MAADLGAAFSPASSQRLVVETNAAQLSLGVEEEFHVVDLQTRRIAPVGPRVLEGLPDNFGAELQRSAVETNSSVVHTLEDLRRDLVSVRRQLAERGRARRGRRGGGRKRSAGRHRTNWA